MTIQQQDTRVNSKRSMQSRSIIGGQGYEYLNYVQGCRICQQFKIDRNPTKPAFMPIKGAKSTRPFASCSMDFVTTSSYLSLSSLYSRLVLSKITITNSWIACSRV